MIKSYRRNCFAFATSLIGGTLFISPACAAGQQAPSAQATAGTTLPPMVDRANSAAQGDRGTVASGNGETAAPEIADIVVTAQKRNETLQRTPVAITVVSGAQLAARGAVDIRQAGDLFPSVRFGEVATSTHLYIRGIGSEQDRASIDPLTAMTFNGVNVPRELTGLNLFDVSSIQLLPGPQSTLYGTSAAGGVVVIGGNPATLQSEGRASFEYGRFGTARGSATVDTPVSGNFAIRASADYATTDGYYASDAGALTRFGARLSALWEPTDDLKVTPWATYYRVTGHAANAVSLLGDREFADAKNPWDDLTCRLNPSRQFAVGANPGCDPFYAGKSRQDLAAVLTGADIVWTQPLFTITLTPGYVHDRQDELQYFGPFPNVQQIRNNQFSTELRVNSATPGSLTWLGGLYVYHDKQFQFFNLNGSAGNPQITNRETTVAAFGEATYRVTQSVRATAGVRLSSNNKKGDGCNCAAANGEGIYFDFNHTWKRVDWKVGVQDDLGEHSMAYATIQTGYTNGAYQYFNSTGLTGIGNKGPAPLVKPSTLISYVVGIKNRLFDNMLTVNDEAFFYDYDNLLIAPFDSTPDRFGNAFYNAKKVHIYGNQLDIVATLTQADRLTINLGYLHARAVNFKVGNPIKNYDGLQLVEAPDWSVGAGYAHVWRLANAAEVEASVNTHFESSWWGTFDHAAGTRQDPATRTDVMLAYRAPHSRWSASVWGRNLENTATLSVGAAAADFAIFTLEPPRTYGATLTAAF